MSTHSDVIVVGAGLVGMFAAMELANQGIQVGLIDSGSPPELLKGLTAEVLLFRAHDQGALEGIPVKSREFIIYLLAGDHEQYPFCRKLSYGKAFFGKIPFPVIHIDTTYKFKEMYAFRDNLAKEWGMDLIIASNEEAIKERVSPKDSKFECCTRLKT